MSKDQCFEGAFLLFAKRCTAKILLNNGCSLSIYLMCLILSRCNILPVFSFIQFLLLAFLSFCNCAFHTVPFKQSHDKLARSFLIVQVLNKFCLKMRIGAAKTTQFVCNNSNLISWYNLSLYHPQH